MTTTKTHDVEATLAQIGRLRRGRRRHRARRRARACPTPTRCPRSSSGRRLPIIADIHFNASLALRAIDAGVAAVRINPGNIGGPDKVEQVVRQAPRRRGTPMRIGANSGSLPEHLRRTATADPAGALVASGAWRRSRCSSGSSFRDFKISVKSTLGAGR